MCLLKVFFYIIHSEEKQLLQQQVLMSITMGLQMFILQQSHPLHPQLYPLQQHPLWFSQKNNSMKSQDEQNAPQHLYQSYRRTKCSSSTNANPTQHHNHNHNHNLPPPPSSIILGIEHPEPMDYSEFFENAIAPFLTNDIATGESHPHHNSSSSSPPTLLPSSAVMW